MGSGATRSRSRSTACGRSACWSITATPRGHPPPLDLLLLAKKGSLIVARPALSSYIGDPATMRAAAAELFDLVARGALQVEVSRSYPLREAAAAHRAVENREIAGAVVLVP